MQTSLFRSFLPIAGAAIAVATPALAQAQTDTRDSGWYIGTGLGASKYSLESADYSTSQVGRALGARGSGATVDSDSYSGAFKLFGGYNFNRYLGAEAALVGLGGVELKYNTKGSGAQLASADYYASAITLAGVGRYEWDSGFLVQGKAGVAFTGAVNDYTVAAPGGTLLTNDPSVSKTNFYWGLGVGYRFDARWALIGEYENFGTVGDSNTTGRAKLQSLMASVQYRF
jgi:OOP family OmpA-OmpF porin